MPRKNNYKQGWYIPENPNKYMGNGAVKYRSSYEQRLFYYLDNEDNVLAWGSESIAIPYIFELDNSQHRYYPDVIATIRTKDGTIKRLVIEVKPYKQTLPPARSKKISSKNTHRFDEDMTMFIKNKNKWDAADLYCKKNNLEFVIMTEIDIYNLK